jgi:hypothetical protein
MKYGGWSRVPVNDNDAVLVCAWCADEYPADENFYQPYCSIECRGAAGEGEEGKDDDR